MFKRKLSAQTNELHIVISSHENCASGSVRVAAALCKTLRKLKGCRFSAIYGGMCNHDMGIKAQFTSSKALVRSFVYVDRVLLIEEERKPLNCDFSVFVKSLEGTKKLCM